MKSISSLIAEMVEMYPSIQLVSDTTLVGRIKAVEDDLYQFIGKETKKDITVTVADKAEYIAADFRNDNLLRVLYFEQGVGKGSSVAGTEYQEIEDLDELKLYEFEQYLKLPLPDSTHNVATVVYRGVPTEISSEPADWDTTYPVIADEYTDLIIYGVIKAISTYGDCPDISINNNYERLMQEKLAKAKADFQKRKLRNKKYKHSHSSTW